MSNEDDIPNHETNYQQDWNTSFAGAAVVFFAGGAPNVWEDLIISIGSSKCDHVLDHYNPMLASRDKKNKASSETLRRIPKVSSHLRAKIRSIL